MLATMIKGAAPLYKAFGNVQIHLLRNADDPTRFIQVVEYQTENVLELSRQKLASDPIALNFVQAWRTLFPGTIEVDVYEDMTNSL